MAWQIAKYELKSVCPMLMHSGRLIDPLDNMTKAMKQVSSKRKKTDADHHEMARIEFLAGLYMSKQGPILPSENIDAMLIAAAKKSREGTIAKGGIFTAKHSLLQYEGARDADEMWESGEFTDRSPVRVGTARVMRTRPRFDEWSAIAEVSYEDTVVNIERVDDWFHVAGTLIGFGDWRPRFGRFDVKRIG